MRSSEKADWRLGSRLWQRKLRVSDESSKKTAKSFL